MVSFVTPWPVQRRGQCARDAACGLALKQVQKHRLRSCWGSEVAPAHLHQLAAREGAL